VKSFIVTVRKWSEVHYRFGLMRVVAD